MPITDDVSKHTQNILILYTVNEFVH